MRTPLQCAPLDQLLGGGVESAAVTEFYGEAGAGKTNACLQLARNIAAEARKVVFIDTEGVSLERLEQISGADYERVKRNVLFFEPYTLREQEQVVDKAARLAAATPDIGLVVLDSLTLHYRVTLSGSDGIRERRSVASQVHALATLARKRDIPVVVTNQVYTNIEQETLEPVGGQLLRHITKAVVQFTKDGLGRRKAVLMKHRSAPEGAQALFRITDRGLAGFESTAAPDVVEDPLDEPTSTGS